MKPRMCSSAFLIVIVLSVMAPSAAAQPSGTLQSMKLLTSEVGWAATQDHLFWTPDRGVDWRDITPRTQSAKSIASVFFLDASDGWVLFASGDENADEPVFEIASTTSSGANWSIRRLAIPLFDPRGVTLSGQGRLDFVDTLHGWMNLDVVSSANFNQGILLSTQDGGMTWAIVPDSPRIAGSIRFINPLAGWMAGGPGGEKLYMTRDGSISWQELSLRAPAAISPAVYPVYDLPVFKDNRHGLLPVTYSGPDGSKPALVLFPTDDGGKTWKPGREYSKLSEAFTGVDVPSTIVGSDLILASDSTATSLTLTVFGPRGKTVHTAANPVSLFSGISDLSFTTDVHGWILVGAELLSTTNGGVTWENITPPRTAHFSTSHNKGEIAGADSHRLRSSPSFRRQAPGSDAEFSSADLGFDICDATTNGKMQTWWDYSPFYDVGVYIGGVNEYCPNTRVTSKWISAIEKQGWALMPIWVGPQAPCTTFKLKFTAKNAATQGKAEADAALMAAKALGLGTIIYYDMEQYTAGGSCGTAVKDFISSWVQELHTSGFAGGVYGAPADANTDWTKASPLPDAVWITKTPKSGPPNISIWGLSPLCDPFSKKTCFSYWSDWSRIHQYLIDQTKIAYGGVQVAPSVDFDVVDAPVAGSGNDNISEDTTGPSSCTKDCTFTYTSIDYPSAKLTNALGINNAGDIVGYYYYLSDAKHGFLYSNGQFTSIEYPNAVQTEAWSINDAGQIVGFYIDSTSNFFGFLYSNGQYTSISLGDNTLTVALGINDDGQIAGYYEDSSGFNGFLDNTNNGVITTVDDGGPTLVRNLNGDSLIVGLIQGGNSFLYDAVTGDYTTFGPTVDGVNDSLEMVGGNTLYDYESGAQTPINYPSATGTAAFGINDYTEIVGNWYDSNGGQHGFLATPMQ